MSTKSNIIGIAFWSYAYIDLCLRLPLQNRLLPSAIKDKISIILIEIEKALVLFVLGKGVRYDIGTHTSRDHALYRSNLFGKSLLKQLVGLCRNEQVFLFRR